MTPAPASSFTHRPLANLWRQTSCSPGHQSRIAQVHSGYYCNTSTMTCMYEYSIYVGPKRHSASLSISMEPGSGSLLQGLWWIIGTGIVIIALEVPGNLDRRINIAWLAPMASKGFTVILQRFKCLHSSNDFTSNKNGACKLSVSDLLYEFLGYCRHLLWRNFPQFWDSGLWSWPATKCLNFQAHQQAQHRLSHHVKGPKLCFFGK